MIEAQPSDEFDQNSYRQAVDKALLAHKLPKTYLNTIEKWLEPIAGEINKALQEEKKRTTLVLGVQGTQGSGKSTCSDFLKLILQERYQRNVVVLSIDDFYLTRDEREKLSENIHPLLSTRGVPGTHDVELALATIQSLKSLSTNQTQLIPRFDKATDDRAPKEEWSVVSGPVDCIILEGWCVGLGSQAQIELETSVNELEAQEDAEGTWRNFANGHLAEHYPELFSLIDLQLVLRAPSFACVHNWRLTQERKLAEKLGVSADDIQHDSAHKIMTSEQITRFIAHYQRLTEHALKTMPGKADWCLWLSEDQAISRMTRCNTAITSEKSFLVVTDLDGTLLDHHNYSWEPAKPALSRLQERGIPVVINTSKTSTEVISLQNDLALREPFIVENGSAMYFPLEFMTRHKFDLTRIKSLAQKMDLIVRTNDEYCIVVFGEPYKKITDIVYSIRNSKNFYFEGYYFWSIHHIIQHTSLSEKEATLSKNREYSEPLLWMDTPENLQLFLKEIEEEGLFSLQGGRFLHILGQTNKALPMLFLKHLLSDIYQRKIDIVALGDSANDSAMLEVANYPVWVKSPKGDAPELNQDEEKIFYTKSFGPEGWHEAISAIIPE